MPIIMFVIIVIAFALTCECTRQEAVEQGHTESDAWWAGLLAGGIFLIIIFILLKLFN